MVRLAQLRLFRAPLIYCLSVCSPECHLRGQKELCFVHCIFSFCTRIAFNHYRLEESNKAEFLKEFINDVLNSKYSLFFTKEKLFVKAIFQSQPAGTYSTQHSVRNLLFVLENPRGQCIREKSGVTDEKRKLR